MKKEKKPEELYISDTAQEKSREYGDVEVLVAGDKEKPKTYEKVKEGQKAEYYNQTDKEIKRDTKIGNLSKEYYNE